MEDSRIPTRGNWKIPIPYRKLGESTDKGGMAPNHLLLMVEGWRVAPDGMTGVGPGVGGGWFLRVWTVTG